MLNKKRNKMKVTKLIIVVLAIGLLGFVSCTKDAVTPTYAPPKIGGLSFKDDLQPVFTANCAACHIGSTLPVLTAGNSYASIMGIAGMVDTVNVANSKLYKEINTGGTMASHSPAGFAAMVLDWIEDGAKNN
jgi:hypothetical protein